MSKRESLLFLSTVMAFIDTNNYSIYADDRVFRTEKKKYYNNEITRDKEPIESVLVKRKIDVRRNKYVYKHK